MRRLADKVGEKPSRAKGCPDKRELLSSFCELGVNLRLLLYIRALSNENEAGHPTPLGSNDSRKIAKQTQERGTTMTAAHSCIDLAR